MTPKFETLPYSRVGFAHEYQPLQGEDLTFVLRRQWKKLGLGSYLQTLSSAS